MYRLFLVVWGELDLGLQRIFDIMHNQFGVVHSLKLILFPCICCRNVTVFYVSIHNVKSAAILIVHFSLNCLLDHNTYVHSMCTNTCAHIHTNFCFPDVPLSGTHKGLTLIYSFTYRYKCILYLYQATLSLKFCLNHDNQN